VIYNRVGFDQHGRRLNRNLVFGMNDRAVRNSSEVLQSHQTEELLSALEETFQPDYMLFDMPPMLAADDAYGFLTHVDAALIVVEAEKTPMAQVDVVERQISEVTGVLGVVLNKCNYTDGVYASDYGYY
jgi:Mrp family chromosome partitioning ATPase